MADLFVLLIIVGCGAYCYQKGTVVKSFCALITAVCGGAAAFSYFEVLAKLLINRDILVDWAQPLCFIGLFFLVFAVLQTIAAKLIFEPVNLGLWPERIGRVICGVLLGFVISGLLLVTLAMAPLPNKYPYKRFDQENLNVQKPDGLILNADGFITGWFNILSSGSFSGKRSFAMLHPSFVDQAFLNRQRIGDEVKIVSKPSALQILGKKAVRIVTEPLKNSKTNKAVEAKAGVKLNIVTIGIKKNVLNQVSPFTLTQLRLVCKPTSQLQNPLTGKGTNIYPIGYIEKENLLFQPMLNEPIVLKIAEFTENVKLFDSVFEVPDDFTPVLVAFKQNNITQVYP